MASNELITFRSKVEYINEFNELREWCDRPENNTSFSGVINAFLPAINYAVHNNIEMIDSLRYILADFGHIHLPIDRPIKSVFTLNEIKSKKPYAPRAEL